MAERRRQRRFLLFLSHHTQTKNMEYDTFSLPPCWLEKRLGTSDCTFRDTQLCSPDCRNLATEPILTKDPNLPSTFKTDFQCAQPTTFESGSTKPIIKEHLQLLSLRQSLCQRWLRKKSKGPRRSLSRKRSKKSWRTRPSV